MIADFDATLRGLNVKNSQNELPIEKFLTKSEEAFSDRVKKDKRDNAASLRSQCVPFCGSGSRSSFFSARPNCECSFLSVILSYSNFVSAPSFGDETSVIRGGGDPGSTTFVIPSRLQVLSRELFGWSLYSIILAFGQVCHLSIVRSRLW